MDLTLQDAYETACRLLGEHQVRETFLIKEIERLTAEVAAVTSTED